MKLGNRKIVFCVIFVVFVVLFFGFKLANAQGQAITDFGTLAVYGIVYALSYLIAKIASIFFALAAFLTDLALLLNLSLLKSPLIQNGWKVVLDFANLGFVLAIIVIAFATILRRETYAIKQTLGKLIVAALLVNFSLVIAGAFISVADNITHTFNKNLKEVSLSTHLTNLLQIQTFGDPTPNLNLEEIGKSIIEAPVRWPLKIVDFLTWITGGKWLAKEVGLSSVNIEEFVMGDSKSDIGRKLSLIASLLFNAAFIFLSVLTYLAIAIMLFIRYIALGILLILSPIVWLLWIFPDTQKHWQQWWDKFIRWTFFAPIVMFFLFIAISSLSYTKEQIESLKQQSSAATEMSVILNYEEQQKGVPITLTDIGSKIIILGILIGGLIAANSLSITGASLAYGFAQKTGEKFGAWSRRMALRGGTWAFRQKMTPEGKSLADRARNFAASRKTGAGRFAAGWLARGTTRLATLGTEDQIKHHAKRIGGWSDADLHAASLTATGPLLIAILTALSKRGESSPAHLPAKNKRLFAKNYQGEEFGNIEKQLLMSSESYEHLKKAEAEPDKKAQHMEAFETSQKEFLGKLTENDLFKTKPKKVFGEKPAFGVSPELHNLAMGSQIKLVLGNVPQLIPRIFSQLKGTELKEVSEKFEDSISKLLKETQAMAGAAEEYKGKIIQKLNIHNFDERRMLREWMQVHPDIKIRNNFKAVNYYDRTLARGSLFQEFQTTAAPTAAP